MNVLHALIFLQLEVPAKMAGTLIGAKGQNFRRIEAKTGVMRLRLVPGPSEVWEHVVKRMMVHCGTSIVIFEIGHHLNGLHYTVTSIQMYCGTSPVYITCMPIPVCLCLLNKTMSKVLILILSPIAGFGCEMPDRKA